MKKSVIFVAAFGLTVLSACKEKKPQEEVITVRQEVFKPQAPIRMQEYKQESDVKWMGSSYHVRITRVPVDSLPMVKDETGQKYVDNSIKLTVTRADGSTFVDRVFTKASFSSYLNDNYRRTGILEAMIFEKVEGNKLEFAVSVAHPQSEDEFIPLEMKIDGDGVVNISRDTAIDTYGGDDDEDL